jgi:hypothetical protein
MTWRLLSGETRRVDGTGEPTYLYGRDPHGSLVYTDSGRFSVHLMRRDQPRFASGDPYNGTDEEIRACYEGYGAYFGHYEVDRENGIVYHHVEGCTFPNWEGSAQKRFFKVTGNRMELRTGPQLLRGAETVSVLEWERVST